MGTKGLRLCESCGQFTHAKTAECSFCGTHAPRAPRTLSTKAKIGMVAAVSMLSFAPVVSCSAYGVPPCTTNQECGPNYVCDTKAKQCVQDNTNTGSENTSGESATTDGGTSE